MIVTLLSLNLLVDEGDEESNLGQTTYGDVSTGLLPLLQEEPLLYGQASCRGLRLNRYRPTTITAQDVGDPDLLERVIAAVNLDPSPPLLPQKLEDTFDLPGFWLSRHRRRGARASG